MSNYISASLPAEDKAKALDLIAQLKTIFSNGIKLSNEQKKSLPKLDDVRLPFTEKGLVYGGKQPMIVPPYTDLAEYNKDLTFYKDTSEIASELESLVEIVIDSRMAAGADAYTAALSIYNSAKNASKMGVPGTQAIVDDLRKLFESKNTTSTTSTTTKA